MTRLCLLLLALSFPAGSFAQDSQTEPAPTQAPADLDEIADPESDVEELEDPLDAKLGSLVRSYYEQIGSVASADDLLQGVRAAKLMLVDGVSLARIEAAVADAVRLNTPGRRIPFQVAVPLRVRPANSETVATPPPRPEPVRPPVQEREPRVSRDDEAAEQAGTVIEERWVKRQEELRARRNRLRLYLQWRDRTREKRILMSVGIPMFAAGWAGTWALAGGTLSNGSELPSVGWTGAIPVAGPFIFGIATEGRYPPVFVFAGFQGIGLALTIVGLAQKHDLPYDRDPTALRIGRDPKTGRALVTLAPRPTGLGAGLLGRF